MSINCPQDRTSSPYGSCPERLAQRLCELGLDEQDLAYAFEVERDVIERWCRENAEFRSAIECGKQHATSRAEGALLRAALGGEVCERRVIRGKVVQIPKYVPANVSASIEWLTRRCPERWSVPR